MVLTRLSTSLALKRIRRASRYFSACSSLSNYASSSSPQERKTKQIHRKKYLDLPVTYISPTGVPATPLGEWFAGADDRLPPNLCEYF